jgi:hypothetical protein
VSSRTVENLVEVLGQETSVWVRIGATMPDGETQLALRLFDIVAGAPPLNWVLAKWVYPRAVFFADTVAGSLVADWLQAESISIADYPIALKAPNPGSLCSWIHFASGSRRPHGPLKWPSEEWTIRFSEARNPSSDVYVGEGLTPSFGDLNAALSALLGIEADTNRSIDETLTFRQQILLARIGGIHILPTSVEVDIEGESLVGASVELAGSGAGSIVLINDEWAQNVSLPTQTGLASGSWVVIRSHNQWLDRRFLDPAYSRLQADDVEFWSEPLARLETLVAGGEGPNTEFKRIQPEETIRIMKTVSAFSNGTGGTILIGVAKDGEIVGAPAEATTPDGLDSLSNMIRNWVSPLPEFDVQTIDSEDHSTQVVAITIGKGPQPPYAAGTTTDTLRYFVRRGATTFAAAPDQVRQLVQSHQPVATDGTAWLQ